MARQRAKRRRVKPTAKLIKRALRYVRVSTPGGFEALDSSVAGRRLDRARTDELATYIKRATYDPLVLGLKARRKETERTPRAQLIKNAKSALVLIASKDPKKKKTLTFNQANALEAIVRLSGRPAILLQDNRPREIPKLWEPRIYPLLDDITKTAQAVGRIGLDGCEGYLGTGFLVAPQVIMTNEHVASLFCRKIRSSRRLQKSTWRLQHGKSPQIDFCQEFGSTKKAVFPIVKVLGVHPTLDLALFEIGNRGSKGARLASPLKLTDDESRATDGSQVYVVGYPAADDRNNASKQHRIFKGIYEKKRLAPGRIMKCDTKKKLFTHDCTTLGGNSGSCVVEFNTGRVVGLHFSGNYLKQNVAILLPNLRKDPLLAKLRVPFVQERRSS